MDASKALVHACVTSRLDYCNSILSGVAAVRQLQSVLSAAARLVIQKRKYDHITTILRDDMRWLLINHRIDYKTILVIYNCPPNKSFMPNNGNYMGSNLWPIRYTP
jgi:hypothetical protein